MDHPASSQPPHLPRKKSAPGHFRFGRVLSRWWWLAAIVIVGMIATAYKLPDWFKMRGPLYKSTAFVEVRPTVDLTGTVSATPPTHGTSPHGSRFMSTQEEIVRATATLEIALKKSDLINRLGGSETAALDRMKLSTTTRQRYGTDLLEISYRDEDPQLAQDALTAIYKSYTDRRNELEIQLRNDEIKALRVEMNKKRDRAEEFRLRLMKIAEKNGITWQEAKGESPIEWKNLDSINFIEKQLIEILEEKGRVQLQLKRLTDLDVEERIRIAASMPDTGFKEVYKTYEKDQEALAALRATGLADGHPSIQQKIQALDEMRTSLEKRASNVRKSMEYKLEILNSRTEKLKALIDRRERGGSSNKGRMSELNIARKEYRTAEGFKDELQAKYVLAKAKFAMPPNNHVVHERPSLPTRAITKGRDFFTNHITAIAIPCALITAFILIYLAEAIFPRQLQRSKTASA